MNEAAREVLRLRNAWEADRDNTQKATDWVAAENELTDSEYLAYQRAWYIQQGVMQ